MRIASLAAFPFLLGALIVPSSSLSPLQCILLWATGVAYHTYACTLNDLADVQDDRGNPTRQSSPLVSGTVGMHSAVFLACVQAGGLVAVAMLAPLSLGDAERVGLLALIGIVTYGNVYQKRAAVVPPVVMDWLFGVSMAGPLMIGARAAGGRLTPALVCIATGFAMQMALLNCGAGNLKDLEADRQAGARTTALLFGVGAAPDGSLHVPPAYAAYCRALLVGSGLLMALSSLWPPVPTVRAAMAAALATALTIAAVHDFHPVLRGRRRPKPGGGEGYIVLGFFSLFAAAGARASLLPLLLLLAATMLWPVGVGLAERRLEALTRRRAESQPLAAPERPGTRRLPEGGSR